ncbi:MAG: TolC family protein [Desulfobacula sp.]|jgi:outer membrane protein|nr:TolC family protein [Desulfobacula sp.]
MKQIIMAAIAISLMMVTLTGASEIKKISIDQAVQLAVENNQDLKTAKNNVRYSTLTLEKEKNDFLPQVTGTINSRITSDYEQSASKRNSYTSDAGVAASLNLFNGFEDEASYEIARHELSSSDYTALRQEQQVIFDTVSAYLNVVKQLREIVIARENLTYNRQKENQIKAFYDAGKSPVIDLYQQQAETADAKSDLIAAENSLKKAGLELVSLMGIKEFDGVKVTMPEFRLSAVAGEINSKSMIQKAFQTRADLLALKKNVSAKQAGVREAKSGRYPSVDLNVGVTGAYTDQYDENARSRSGQDNLDSYVGVRICLPLFDKHLTRIRTGQARIDKQTAVLSLEKLEDQIRVELGEAVADYKSACETIKAVETRLLYAQKALESADQRYKVGKSGLTELILIRSDLVEARNKVVEAQIDQLLKNVSIFFYRGDLGLSHLLFHSVVSPAEKELS